MELIVTREELREIKESPELLELGRKLAEASKRYAKAEARARAHPTSPTFARERAEAKGEFGKLLCEGRQKTQENAIHWYKWAAQYVINEITGKPLHSTNICRYVKEHRKATKTLDAERVFIVARRK